MVTTGHELAPLSAFHAKKPIDKPGVVIVTNAANT
jgi:hypothetical protein